MSRLELAGVLSRAQAGQTAASIAVAQEPSGLIPWYPGSHADPWDHVEAAMGLDVAGRHHQAARAYEWLRRRQRADGSWASTYRGEAVEEATADANFVAYVAVGVWHHYLLTGDGWFLERLWPTVRRAIDFAVGLQGPAGEIRWARDPQGRPAARGLVTSSSCIYLSLRCALAAADALGVAQPDWELAAGRLGHAVACHPERFQPKRRWSMDWYYPVLGGVVRGEAAAARIAERWGEFVVQGLGIRCVADRPWVTGAETCELVVALNAIGDQARAEQLLGWIQHLRDPDGSYWTGYVYRDATRWPVERSTWTGAAVLLAVDAVADATPAAGIFRGEALPVGVDLAAAVCEQDPEQCTPASAGVGDAAEHA